MRKECISKDWLFASPQIQDPVRVDLPHDYSVLLPRDKECKGGASTGFFTGDWGKYEKYMELGDEEHIILDIDGAYMCSRVSLNENLLIMHPHGYTPILQELTPEVRKGRINKLQILTQNLQPSTRWYSGAGVYRDVYLWTGGSVRIEPRDIFINTTSANEAEAVVSVNIIITADNDSDIRLEIKIKDDLGNTVCVLNKELSVLKGKNEQKINFEISQPKLWDTENPNIYSFEACILKADKCEDEAIEHFGIRTISADSKNGFMLNGKSIKLRGGCIHHDHAGLGAASFPAAEERKVKKLKEVGFNAIRIAHNPPSLALLDACDRLGMLVMDEAFDMWNMPKNSLDYSLWFADWWDRDIKSMVIRDRNHPSVISYSIGNEIPERNNRSDGYKWAERIADEIRKFDPYKLITSGVNEMWEKVDDNAPEQYKKDFLEGYNDIGDRYIGSSWDKRTEDYFKPLDIAGYNYLYERYEYDHENYPERVMWGSETHALNFYHSWQTVIKNSYVIGDFTWSACDNLGEAGTGCSLWARDGVIHEICTQDYPWRSNYQGDLDLCGYRKPQSYFREAVWLGNTEPRIFTTHPEHYGEGFSGTGWHWYDVSESWTFEDKYIGRPVKTEVYSDADEIKFELNGKYIGSSVPKYGIASIDIPYEKGTLTAISYKNNECKKFSLTTVSEPYKLSITAEKREINADNRDLCYLDILVCDKDGLRVPYADNEIICEVEGGELMCIFSGDPKNEDMYSTNRCHAFKGTAVAVVRAKNIGDIRIKVFGNGIKEAGAIVKAIE